MTPRNHLTARAFLGREIRRAREDRKMSRAALARELFVSESLVAAWESGRQPPMVEHIVALSGVLTFGPDIVRRILEELVDGEVSPEWTGKWLAIEQRADMLLSYEHSIVPGLLQSADYARTVLQHNQVSTLEIEEQVRVRLGRQEIFSRDDPPTAVFIMDERVLRNLVDNPGTMSDQLLLMLEAAKRPNTIIQIIPDGTGYHPGRVGAFMMAKFDGAEVAYQDGTLRGQVLEDREDVNAFSRIWMNIHGSALTQAASAELIAKVVEEWRA